MRPETLTDEMVREALVDFAADCLRALHAEAYPPKRSVETWSAMQRVCDAINSRATQEDR